MLKRVGATVMTTYRKIEAMVDLSAMDVASRTDRGCQVAVMGKNARWITRVRILCGHFARECPENNRDTVGAAAVVQASAQISVIRPGSGESKLPWE